MNIPVEKGTSVACPCCDGFGTIFVKSQGGEPFGRQPKPVTVTIQAEDPIDVVSWLRILTRAAEYKGDSTQIVGQDKGAMDFKIYPRAVND